MRVDKIDKMVFCWICLFKNWLKDIIYLMNYKSLGKKIIYI